MSPRLPDAAAWAEIEPYLNQALELDPQAREIWLAELTNTRPDTARAVQAMLLEREALDSAGFLGSPPLTSICAVEPELRDALSKEVSRELVEIERARIERLRAFDLEPGRIVGPYKLLHEIGHGGMSSVWLAQHNDGMIKREIALKLPLIQQRFHLERFQRERDLLASLTHPNIARLYDAGVTESGQPYLAMEYVAGTAITHACDQQQATIRQRLQLFMQVLEVVQFAHAHLIIHRDLKPSNILVTPEGRVVLLDFGIGKLLGEGAQEPQLTEIFGRPLTLDYAAPEQISGKALSTASDIYSLGVILHELLTGARPYRLRHDSRAVLEAAILGGDVKPPSQSQPALSRALSGDLDTITLKAMKLDPLERYASSSAFAQDIHNHLHRLPVSARPDSFGYRAARFISRHKTPVIAATIATVAMMSGTAVALWQASVAATERDRSGALALRTQAVSDFLDMVITDAAVSPTPITVSQLLERSERLALSDRSDNPETRAAVLDTIARHYGTLEEFDRSERLLQLAEKMLEQSRDHALRSRVACNLALTRYYTGRAEESLRALELEAQRAIDEPEIAAECLSHLVGLELQTNTREAMRHGERGLALLAGSGRRSASLQALLLSHLAFGHYLSGDLPRAEQYFAQSAARFREIGKEHSEGALINLNDWATALLGAGIPQRALQMYEEAERLQRQREPGAEPDTTSVGNRATALLRVGRYEDARNAFELECRLGRQRHDDYSELHCESKLAELMLETQALDRATEHLQLAKSLAAKVPDDYLELTALTILDARIDLARGNVAEARTKLETITPPDLPQFMAIRLLRAKAETELLAANTNLALDYAQRSLEMATTLQGGAPHSNQTGQCWLLVGQARQLAAQREPARAAFQSAIANLENTVDASHPALLQARQLLAALAP